MNLLDRIFAPEVLKWRQPSMEVGRVSSRKQRNEARTQTNEEHGNIIEALVCDLVRDQKDTGHTHDHDKDVTHSGVVVDTERAARCRVAVKRIPVGEPEPEWKHEAEKAKAGEIWQRFPKFIIGYVATFLLILFLALGATPPFMAKIKSAMGEANTFRGIFFVLTFFTIGVMSNFRKLWEEGIGKLAAVYVVCLFGFVIWVGLIISWVFFSGVKPPLAAG